MSGVDVRLAVAACCCFAAFIALGLAVARRAPWPPDRVIALLRGTNVRLALVFTISGRAHALGWLSAAAVVLFAIARAPLWIPAMVIASQVLSQTAVHGFKVLYGRPRPDDWLIRLESGGSYPSGHAATSVTFYGAWLLVTLLAPMPLAAKAIVAVVLAVWIAGIDWSRIALAAHYATDVLGGILFGCAWTCVMVMLALHLSRVHAR